MADVAAIEALWKSMGNTGDRPAGWWGPSGSAENPNYTSTPRPDYNAIVQQALKLAQEAAAPAIKSLEESMPEVSAKYASTKSQLEAEKTPLEQRYQLLLNQITGNQAAEEQRTGLATAQELGRRGISSLSGAYASETNKALSPITQGYTNLYQQTGLARESDLRNLSNTIANLTNSEVEQLRAIMNTKTQLQTATSSDAVQAALSRYSIDQGAYQNAIDQMLQQQQFQSQQSQQNIANDLAQQQFEFQKSSWEKEFNKPSGTGSTTPPNLNFETITDPYTGETTIVAFDPKTGKVVNTYAQPGATSTNTGSSTGGIGSTLSELTRQFNPGNIISNLKFALGL